MAHSLTDFELGRATYYAHVDQLRPFTGKWVLIRASEIVGIYPSWEEVIEMAHKKFAPGSYYITQIETVEYFSRDLIFPEMDLKTQAA